MTVELHFSARRLDLALAAAVEGPGPASAGVFLSIAPLARNEDEDPVGASPQSESIFLAGPGSGEELISTTPDILIYRPLLYTRLMDRNRDQAVLRLMHGLHAVRTVPGGREDVTRCDYSRDV